MTKALMVDAREKDSSDFGGRFSIVHHSNRSDPLPALCQRFGLTFPAVQAWRATCLHRAHS